MFIFDQTVLVFLWHLHHQFLTEFGVGLEWFSQQRSLFSSAVKPEEARQSSSWAEVDTPCLHSVRDLSHCLISGTCLPTSKACLCFWWETDALTMSLRDESRWSVSSWRSPPFPSWLPQYSQELLIPVKHAVMLWLFYVLLYTKYRNYIHFEKEHKKKVLRISI